MEVVLDNPRRAHLNDLFARYRAQVRNRSPCRWPTVKEKRRCKMHGAYAGPPRRNRNAWKHGGRSGEMLRQQASELLSETRELVEKVR